MRLFLTTARLADMQAEERHGRIRTELLVIRHCSPNDRETRAMNTLEWKDTNIIDSSGAIVGQASTPFRCILDHCLTWLTNDISPDARQLQKLYQPVHKNYVLELAGYAALPDQYNNVHLRDVRRDFDTLAKYLSIQVTTEASSTLLGFVATAHDHTTRPIISYTTLTLEALSTAHTKAEQHHILLAIFILTFHELVHVFGRWVSLFHTIPGANQSEANELNRNLDQNLLTPLKDLRLEQAAGSM